MRTLRNALAMFGLGFAHNAPGEKWIEVRGEIVDGGAAGFGDILGARTRLPIEKGGKVAVLDALLVFTRDRRAVDAHLHDAMAGGDRGDDGKKIAARVSCRGLRV